MISTTYKFSVSGKNHAEIASKVEKEIHNYVGSEEDTVLRHTNCEIIVEYDNSQYTAQVIARIKNDNR